MNNFTILFICCALLCGIGFIQNTTCGSSDKDKNNTCNTITGGIACVICCGSIIYMLSK